MYYGRYNMLKKLTTKEVSGDQREFAERTANAYCDNICDVKCPKWGDACYNWYVYA